MLALGFVTVALSAAPAIAFVTGIDPNHPPHQSEPGQVGYNDCANYPDSQNSMCQSLWLNSIEDFCMFAPPEVQEVGESEERAVAWCTQKGHGARIIPAGTISGAQWIQTPHFIQISAVGDFTKVNVPARDEGGEYDCLGANGVGNPIGGIVFSNHEWGFPDHHEYWSEFLGYNEFSIRACYNGPDAERYCQHIYDVMGSQWNAPGKYEVGVFEQCAGDGGEAPGEYAQPGGWTSTFHQGDAYTPDPHPAPATSSCISHPSIAPKARARRANSPQRHAH